MFCTPPDPTRRFSDRVDAYVRSRPGYPDALVETVKAEANLLPKSVIADIGSGTGISTELFLREGFEVHAVEPNDEMREAAERRFADHAGFHSVAGSAEGTMLPRSSVDLVIAGQAFHWFDRDRARQEFKRILRPDGFVALFWNSRQADTTPFLRAYEQLLHEYGTDYGLVNHRNIDSEGLRLFLSNSYRYVSFANEQVFDFAGLEERLLSSSYVPGRTHPRYHAMLQQLRHLFDEHQEGNRVRILYTTELHIGRLR